MIIHCHARYVGRIKVMGYGVGVVFAQILSVLFCHVCGNLLLFIIANFTFKPIILITINDKAVR